MKCQCGNDKFFALQRVTMLAAVLVDENGVYKDEAEMSDHPDSDSCVDYEKPEGPFICTECGLRYEELCDDAEPIDDDDEESSGDWRDNAVLRAMNRVDEQ